MVEHRPGKENISDYTSRYPMSPLECCKFEMRTTKEMRHYVNYVVMCNRPKAVTRDQVKEATDEDPAPHELKKCVNQGWIDTISNFVVPAKLRQRMLEITHEGHQGLVRTKQLLRAHVWFPGMDSQCDMFVSACIACQSNTPQTYREQLKMTELPEGPWDKVSVDFCGPMANGDLALVFYCQYFRYPVVKFVGSTSEKATIPVFKRLFDTYGVPKEIKSDNGPPFNSHKFEEYSQAPESHARVGRSQRRRRKIYAENKEDCTDCFIGRQTGEG